MQDNPSKQNAFLKNSALFLVGSMFSKLLNFALLPLYTSRIPSADFGVYDITTLMISMFSSVVYFEIWSATLRYLYDYKDIDKPRVIKSSAIILAFSTIAYIIVSITYGLVFKVEYTLLVVSWGIATSFATYLCFLARGLNKNVDFAISGILNTFVCLCANILLILWLKTDYSALYVGTICGMLVQVIYLLFRLKIIKKTIHVVHDLALTKEIFRYALPLCINTVAYWLLHSAARLIYNLLRGDTASGIFSVGNKFGTIIVLATTCFTFAWQDLSFSASKSSPNTPLYSAASKKYLVFLCGALTTALPILKVVFPIFVRGDYGEAIEYVPLFLIVAVASGYSAFVGNIFYAIKDTKIISISTVISGIITVVLAFPLIELWGANGTNIAVLIGFSVNIIIRFAILKKKIEFQIPFRPLVLCIAWILLSTVLYNNLGTGMLITLFAVNGALLVIIFRNDISKLMVKSS